HGQASPELFIEQYIPTLRALLATFNFLKMPGGTLDDVNEQPDVRNTVLLDLNNGLDLSRSVGDFSANDFAGQAKVAAIYGENLKTPALVIQRTGEDLQQALNPFGEITPFDSFFARHAGQDETWYQDVSIDADGDTTVPV